MQSIMDVSSKYSSLFYQTFIVAGDTAQQKQQSVLPDCTLWQFEAAAGAEVELTGNPDEGHAGSLH